MKASVRTRTLEQKTNALNQTAKTHKFKPSENTNHFQIPKPKQAIFQQNSLSD